MPKRLLDGERLWRSDKLRLVKPEEFRAEYANMLALALANGTFECSPDLVWREVYAFNRPSVTSEIVARMLDEFERVKLLFRWKVDGKMWGYWVGIEEKGLLPTKKQIKQSRYRVGKPVPKDLLNSFISNEVGTTCNHDASNVHIQTCNTLV